LRADNADQRLVPKAMDLGLLDLARIENFENKIAHLEKGRGLLGSIRLTPQEADRAGLPVNADGQRRTGQQLLAFPGIRIADLDLVCPELKSLPAEIREQLEIEALYATYVDRQSRDAAALERDEAQIIPDTLEYEALQGLSAELRSKLSRIRPRTLGQAGRIDGMTPAALALILTRIRRDERQEARRRA
jgi:tRNA uridine 5-carboxymethylaminomethyl modification enzyme